MQNNFCGLVRTDQTTESLTTVLGRMGQLLDSWAGSSVNIQTHDDSGLAISGSHAEQHLVSDERLIVAISGAPYWSGQELSGIAQKTGFPNSIAIAYRRDGPDFLQNLRGPFALALIDPDKNETIIAIDRLGIGQIHYTHDPKTGLAFGNNTASLQAHGGFSADIDKQAIFDYLYFHMIPSPGSIFENYYKLQPGEYLTCRDGSITRGLYWSPKFEDTSRSSRADLEAELWELLRQSIRRCSTGDNIGCFLSGGIDSSTIAGLLSELDRPTKSFTIGFREEGYDETNFARLTSEHFETVQTEYFVSPQDVVDALPKIAASYDEPFGNSSVVPTYYCAQTAQQNGIATMLAGDGGDELFGGNVRYVTQQVFDIYGRIPNWLKSTIIEPISFHLPGASKFPPTRKLQSYIRQAKIPMPDRLETYNYFNRTPTSEILHSEFHESINQDRPIELLRERYDSSQSSSMLNNMLALDWKFTLADNDLRKVNQMCMLGGVEVRYPFLDDDLLEFSARVPPNMKIHLFRLRHFFKRSMRDFLPKAVLQKSKHGFGLPFGIWMNSYGPLQEMAYDNLSDIRKRNIINPDYLNGLIQSHRSEHAHYYGEFIWVLMMLELWLKNHDTRSVQGPGI